MKMNKKSKKGFTLIELIVVVAILAILAAIAVPNFIGMTKKAQTATEVAAASEFANAINIYNTIHSTATLTTANASAAAALGTESLMPTFDASIADPATHVYARIGWNGGVAFVSNKANIG